MRIIDSPLSNNFNKSIKRIFDIVISFFVIIFVLSWMIPLFGLIIKFSSSGTIFFTQTREGFRGKNFRCIKFRSMIENSLSDSKMAKSDDYRITKFGKFLREKSLDEIPQFINVFLGDMSVVGPRPHPIKLNQDFKERIENYNERHSYKPGITGLAQILGYSGYVSSFNNMNNRVQLDLFYFKKWNFCFDVKIILKTTLIIFKGLILRN